VGQHDVEREQHGVGERQGHAERLSLQAHVGEQVDPRHGYQERHGVAGGARTQCRERHHRQELDRGDRAQRQPIDGDVEAAVHQRQDRAPTGEQALPP